MIARPAALGVLLSLCVVVPAAASSSSRLYVDERVELLGVVQHLAAETPDALADGIYRDEVERRFGALRGHAAVRLYAQASRRPGGENLGILLLYFSAPPALKLERKELRLPYVEKEEDKAFFQRFLWELRDFAAQANFAGFYREQRPYYRTIEQAASAELGELDPAAAVEKYLGITLDCRNHYILSPLYRAGQASSFILPYPDPAIIVDRPQTPFEVYTLLAWMPRAASRAESRHIVFDVPSANLWHELLYVFIDPSFHHYEARYVPNPGAFYGEAAGCRERAINCLKSYTVAALSERLSLKAWKWRKSSWAQDEAAGRYTQSLTTRLEEYEAGKATLWEFYPRLFSVFFELAHPGVIPPALPEPGRPVASAGDFFDRRWRQAYKETR